MNRTTIAVAAIVFLANAGLMVLQLLASRWLVPLIGSSLETWTAIIGAFLLGIAVGNAVGGTLADRFPTPRLLTIFLWFGALAALSMMFLPRLLTGFAAMLPFAIRVPVLAFLECFPTGFVLSLITPLAIKLGLRDVSRGGRTVGIVFALGTLGCLAGNYITGFVLIPAYTISTITMLTAGLFLLAAALSLTLPRHEPLTVNPAVIETQPELSMRQSLAIVFAASFCGMALELAATRILAQIVGMSLFTWTGVIGVMLAGTAAGNALGGWLADRRGGTRTLSLSLLAAALGLLLVLPLFYGLIESGLFRGLPLMTQIVALSLAIFFLPMMLLGTISPQVIRLTLASTAGAGRTAGRIYAGSTAGAIAGTFAAGYVLISTLGMDRTVLLAAAIVALLALAVKGAMQRPMVLYGAFALLGLTLAGVISTSPANLGITRETNYFTIRVQPSREWPDVLALRLDRLTHSLVKLDDPSYLAYFHERIQLELLHERQARRVLVIGGGGYTFPRAAKTLNPALEVDVVEIDPGVTAVSTSHLGLDPALGIRSFHCDGRQFVAEQAAAGHYDLITLDAVNDLSVPSHLLTREFNTAVKRTLAPGGVYTVTVIDHPARGKLWKAVVQTLRASFAHVECLTHQENWNSDRAEVHLLYASDTPLNVAALRISARRRSAKPFDLFSPSRETVQELLAPASVIVLTDDYAPVDDYMSGIFRERK